MDKIYCINCEFFKDYKLGWGDLDYDCESPKNIKIKFYDDYLSKRQTEKKIWRPSTQNKNNNCKYFKKKKE